MIEQVSAKLVKCSKVIVIEDLAVQSMTASARGAVEEPGRNVAAKAGLNRSILDKGWGMFRVRCEQKIAVKGGSVVRIPPQYTSQRCSCCGHVSAESRVNRDTFACISCKQVMHADVNAACNIRQLGLLKLGLISHNDLAAGTVVTVRGAFCKAKAAKREQIPVVATSVAAANTLSHELA